MRKAFCFTTALVVLGVIAYWTSLQAGFVFDDLRLNFSETFSRHFPEVFQNLLPKNRSLFIFRPLIHASLAINYFIGGMNPFGFHLMNLAVHIASSITLFCILKRLIGCQMRAFLIAAIWMVHPLQTQAVTYMIQRCESWMGFFYLAAFYTLLRSHESPRKSIWISLSWLSVALGMGCKQVMITAPFMLFIFDRIFLEDSWKAVFKKRWRYYVGLLILAATYLYWIFFSGFEGRLTEKSAGFDYEGLTSMSYALSQPSVIVHYLRLSLWPHPLVFDYQWPVAQNLKDHLPSLILLLSLFSTSVIALKKYSKIAFLGLWFFIILTPSSSFIPIEDLAAEHRMYLSLISIAAAFILLLFKLLPKIAALGIALCILSLFSWQTIARNQVYANELTLWADTVAKKPLNARAHNNYGMALAKAEKGKEALKHYQESLNLEPENERVMNNLANLMFKENRNEDASLYYKRALALDPHFDRAHNNYANLLAYQGDFETALYHYQSAIELNPKYRNAYVNSGQVLGKLGRYKEAIARFTRATELQPEATLYKRMGHLLAVQGNFVEAQSHFEKALKLSPADKESLESLQKIKVIKNET